MYTTNVSVVENSVNDSTMRKNVSILDIYDKWNKLNEQTELFEDAMYSLHDYSVATVDIINNNIILGIDNIPVTITQVYDLVSLIDSLYSLSKTDESDDTDNDYKPNNYHKTCVLHVDVADISSILNMNVVLHTAQYSIEY